MEQQLQMPLLKWIPLLPLIGFVINGFWYTWTCRQGNKKAGALIPGVIATAAILGSFCVALSVFLTLKALPEHERVLEYTWWSWIHVESFKVDMGLRVDTLSTLFTLVITGIGTLIHLYSIGYMSHDATPGKFFTYLNLFCFAMLMLVMGSSLPVLFLGWEGVGVCSYLLIGYWYTDIEKAKAGKKAFIVNRIGDFGFLIGMFLIYKFFGTLDLVEINRLLDQKELMAAIPAATITMMCLFLFLGCTGKSAQIPLYVWLPDAMAGPTPVSALIHAATMVTSGIYMLARLNKLFVMSHDAMLVIAVVGALTALMAASIAVVQKDIKKVLAYSTVSQLGYMFLACGVGAFTAGVFHVITHAFFKALMFLGAGSVIHGMHEEQNIMKMGGLKSKMKITYLTFMMGWLAICGIPVFSGFFSKDEILWMTFASPHGSKLLWILAAVTAIMTAFYMTRLFYLTFLGEKRYDEKHVHPHESPLTMTLPLVILAVLSVVGGFIGIPHASWLAHWLEPVIKSHGEGFLLYGHSVEYVLMALSTLGAIAGILFAFKTYRSKGTAESRQRQYSGLYHRLENKWFVDEGYERVFIKPLYQFSMNLWKKFDVAVIDRIVMAFGKTSLVFGEFFRVFQTGAVQSYAFTLFVGVALTVGYLIYAVFRH